MKKIILVSMLILMVAGIAYAKDFELTKKAGPYTVVVKMDKNPPVMGDNGITITIKDAAGKVVKDAKVAFDYEMPAMPGMPAMAYKGQPQLKGDSYVGTDKLLHGRFLDCEDQDHPFRQDGQPEVQC